MKLSIEQQFCLTDTLVTTNNYSNFSLWFFLFFFSSNFWKNHVRTATYLICNFFQQNVEWGWLILARLISIYLLLLLSILGRTKSELEDDKHGNTSGKKKLTIALDCMEDVFPC